MSGSYYRDIDERVGAVLRVEYTTVGGTVVDYAVVLLVKLNDATETVRVYDGAHDSNEMHRYTRAEGKQVASVFHGGTLSEGMNAAIDEIERRYVAMIEGWERG